MGGGAAGEGESGARGELLREASFLRFLANGFLVCAVLGSTIALWSARERPEGGSALAVTALTVLAVFFEFVHASSVGWRPLLWFPALLVLGWGIRRLEARAVRVPAAGSTRRPWGRVAVGVVLLAVTQVATTQGLPFHAAWRWSRDTFERELAAGRESRPEPVDGRWLGVFHVQDHLRDDGGGEWFVIGRSAASWNFGTDDFGLVHGAHRELSPYAAHDHFELIPLDGDWCWFRAWHDWD